jgi:hypothetical protein
MNINIIDKKENKAFIKSNNEMYIAKYKDNGIYIYEPSIDEYSTYNDISNTLWCPPIDWIKPVIYWDRIWTEMDLERNGYRRPYIYFPDRYIDNIKYNAWIQFYDYTFSKL